MNDTNFYATGSVEARSNTALSVLALVLVRKAMPVPIIVTREREKHIWSRQTILVEIEKSTISRG